MESLKRLVKSFFKNIAGERVIIFFTPVPYLRRLFFLLRPRHFDYKPQTLRRATRNGINYELDISDWIEWNIYFKNHVEPREQLYRLAKKGDIIIDVGINIGETLLNLASKTGETGKIFGFEPNPSVFEKCKKNISLNPSIKNISLFNYALGQKESELFIEERDERNKGMNRLSSNIKGEKVKVITLDSFISQQNISQLNLLKIDVEGFEMNVLKGAEQSINRFHPILFIELNDELLQAQQSSAKELVSWLTKHGYKISNAKDGSSITVEDDFSNKHVDIVAQSI